MPLHNLMRVNALPGMSWQTGWFSPLMLACNQDYLTEKALLDLIYLTPNGDDKAYIQELRLQNLEVIDIDRLRQFVKRAKKPKLERALPTLLTAIQEEADTFEML